VSPADFRACWSNCQLFIIKILSDLIIYSSVNVDEGTFKERQQQRAKHLHPLGQIILSLSNESPPPIDSVVQFEALLLHPAPAPIRFHDLRHISATISLAAGLAIRVVPERRGHSPRAFTLRRYAHVLPGMQAQAAEQFAALLRSGEKSLK